MKKKNLVHFLAEAAMLEPFLRADQAGIRLEIVAGLPIWEPSPVYKHQKAVDSDPYVDRTQ